MAPVYSANAHKEIINSIDGVGGQSIGCGAPEIVTGSRDGEIYKSLRLDNHVSCTVMLSYKPSVLYDFIHEACLLGIICNGCRFGFSFMTNCKIFAACLVCSKRQKSEFLLCFKLCIINYGK